jgi:transposase InsO family protein
MTYHSNQGGQYAGHNNIVELKNKFQIGMSGKGNPRDNATAKSFMKTLKAEYVYLWEYRTIDGILKRIPSFIFRCIIEKQLHSSVGNEFEAFLEVHQDMN